GMCKIHLKSKQKELSLQNEKKVLDAAIEQAKKELKELPKEEQKVLEMTGWTPEQFELLKTKKIYKRMYTGSNFNIQLSIDFANKKIYHKFKHGAKILKRAILGAEVVVD